MVDLGLLVSIVICLLPFGRRGDHRPHLRVVQANWLQGHRIAVQFESLLRHCLGVVIANQGSTANFSDGGVDLLQRVSIDGRGEPAGRFLVSPTITGIVRIFLVPCLVALRL